MVIDVERRIDLLHDAILHHEDVVRERHCLRLIMCHVDDGEAVLHLQLFDLKAHLLTQMRVETRERLIEQHDIGIDRKGSSECYALFAAAREEVRASFRCRQEIRRLQCLGGTLTYLRLGELADAQRKRHILIDRQMRPDGKCLKHHAEVPLLGRQIVVFLR